MKPIALLRVFCDNRPNPDSKELLLMRNFLFAAAMSVGVGVTGVGPLTAPAQAQELELRIDRNGPSVRRIEDCDPRFEDCGRYSSRRELMRTERRGCSEDRALDKAERMGMRRARVVSAGRRTIEVRGRDRYGDRMYVTFGRDRGCPLL